MPFPWQPGESQTWSAPMVWTPQSHCAPTARSGETQATLGSRVSPATSFWDTIRVAPLMRLCLKATWPL